MLKPPSPLPGAFRDFLVPSPGGEGEGRILKGLGELHIV